MANLTFTQEIIKTVIGGVVPVAIAAIGGQWIVNQYQLAQKRLASRLELARFVRERQYESLEQLYDLFGRFMSLYRIINSQDTDLADVEIRKDLLKRCAEAEAGVDAVILRIASEFTHEYQASLAQSLGNLRQSVQIWRERISEGKRLPFDYSQQQDYVRFKTAFAQAVTYLAASIFSSLEPLPVRFEAAQTLVLEAFSNKWEKHGYHDVGDTN
ncbi:MAG: hypothetical protein F6K10_39235 [Moorea sp. SIO2B7]|nr:hypothetical protein [Moorena sp. SIO2B7]